MLGLAFLAASLVFSPADANLAYETARELAESYSPRDGGTIRGRIAANYLLDRASAAGADVRRDSFMAKTPNGEREFINLYAEFKNGGQDDRWVILVSHFDTKSGVKCPGANDGASTSGLLVGLANAISDWDAPHGNLLLVWTDGEECVKAYGENDGLYGARRAADYVRERGLKVQAVICVDMLGDKDLQISVPKNGSHALAKIAQLSAKRVGYPDLIKLSDEIVKDDHVPFLEAKMNAIDLIDFSYGPDNSWWHTPEDTIDKVSKDSLLKSGKVLAEMINILL